MDVKAFPSLIVGVVVALVLAGACLPIFAETTSATDTFTNEGYFRMDKITSSDETTHTIVWLASNPTIITVDSVDMDITTWGAPNYGQLSIYVSETDIFRAGFGSGGQTVTWIQLRGSTINYAQAYTSFTATIGGGDVSIMMDSEETARTMAYTDAYIIQSDKGDYVMKKANSPAYMNSDSIIYSLGYTPLSNGGGTDNVVFSVIGNVEDVDIQVVRQSTANEITISDIVIDKTAVNGYLDLYQFNKITFVATENATANNCTYSYVIVPYEVTAEKAVHPDGALTAILNILPILVIAGLVTGAVTWFVMSKR